MRRLVVSLAVLALAGCSSSTPSGGAVAPTPTPTLTDASPAAIASTPPAVPVADPTIAIAGFAFEPNPLVVKPGTRIPVTNADSVTHDLASDSPGLFKAVDVVKGTPVTFTAPTKPGTYTYFCSYHPKRMHGSLTVV
jgi:plastocyanin